MKITNSHKVLKHFKAESIKGTYYTIECNPQLRYNNNGQISPLECFNFLYSNKDIEQVAPIYVSNNAREKSKSIDLQKFFNSNWMEHFNSRKMLKKFFTKDFCYVVAVLTSLGGSGFLIQKRRIEAPTEETSYMAFTGEQNYQQINSQIQKLKDDEASMINQKLDACKGDYSQITALAKLIYKVEIKNSREDVFHWLFEYSTGYNVRHEDLQMILFLLFAEIKTKEINTSNPKFNKKEIVNFSSTSIFCADVNYDTTTTSSAFKVNGFFRWQHYGENNSLIKLIYVDEFEKNGYTRTAGKLRLENEEGGDMSKCTQN